MNQRNPSTLLHEATTGLEPDVDRLVAGGVARGRTLRRRRRVGTALAAAAVVGVLGAAASLVPTLGDRGQQEAPVATDPTGSTGSPSPGPEDDPLEVAVSAEDVPGAVEELLGRQGAGPLRRDPPYGAVSRPRELIAHFSWQETLASLVIEPFSGKGRSACESAASGPTYRCVSDSAGDPLLLWGPTTGDGVAAQGATVWRAGFQVSVLSYNAAEGKGSPTLFAEPPLTMDDLTLLAASDRWFR